ncbi:bifunctional DNA primase/polymerase [Stutzerimonas stutzeri]|uniref:bifunctional DNA primase/polymerase n=1 Tax=Stutzerimonas stutzeri TaxID=316 RepID=UPI002447542A|nr:bifunctional DNA primase/polymerase [Stutzerimonas stutzeri]MDH0154343.1 bifunctional DNA primase/polymerase [Stutzerimonas stutzeri]
MGEVVAAPISLWARRYIETFGLALVAIEPGEKAPKGKGWNQPGGYFTDAGAAEAFWQQNPRHNMGVVLGPSRVCSLDVDDVECTRQVLWDLLAVDLDALALVYPTAVGNPARFRILFRVPDGVELSRHALSWPKKDDPSKRFTVVEFRAGLVQDVLPPSIHPGTGKPYEWRTAPSAEGLPELPLELLQAWQNWDIFKRDAEAACPWGVKPAEPKRSSPPRLPAGDQPSVIDAFNRAHDVEQLLAAHGYKKRGAKWLYPASSTGLAGVTVTDGRVFSHHAADPLANDHQNDAFDVFCLLEHGGDVPAAIKAAARSLGLEQQKRPASHSTAAPKDDAPPLGDVLPGAPTSACGEAVPELAGAHSPGGAGGFRIGEQELLKDFVLIYGTDLVWDCNRRRMVKLAALREVVGRERIKLWQESQYRRVAEDVVFDPTESCGPTMLNLFDGFKMTPSPVGQAGCQKILAHLGKLCGERRDEYVWLLRWIAYPLQNPGAKMATSVVMFGAEGPGKSLVWEKVVKRIYGEYGVTIGQAQLESQFTGWQSRKLFALAEEVVSRAEMRHYKGLLKHLVTGETLQINEKMQSLREEHNHLNFVFLSNSTVPLELDDGDRRYLVLYVDKVPPKEYFAELVEEIENGGIEAFYQYMLTLPMEGFNEHTKPPLNDEKQALIEGSMSPARYFLRVWQRGDIDLPYGAAVAGDLYRAFCRWCERSNEFKRREREFYQEVQRDMDQVRKDIKFPSAQSDFKTCRIYVPKGEGDKHRDKDWLQQVALQCRAFHGALDERYQQAAA